MEKVYQTDPEWFKEKFPTVQNIEIDVVQNHVDDDAPPSTSREWHFTENTIQNHLPCTYRKCSEKGGIKLFHILSLIVAKKLTSCTETYICSNGCKNNPRSTCANSFKVDIKIAYQDFH